MQLPALAAAQSNQNLPQMLALASQVRGNNEKSAMLRAQTERSAQDMKMRGEIAGLEGEERQQAMRRYGMLYPEKAAQIADAIGKMDANQRAKVEDMSKKAGGMLYSVLSAPKEQQPMLYQRVLSAAAQSGMDVSQMPKQFDPMAVQAQLAMHMDVKDLLDVQKHNAPIAVADGTALVDPRTNQAVFNNEKTVPKTPQERNAAAMGLKPGTPEYVAKINELASKPGVTVNMGGKVSEKMLGFDVDTVKDYKKQATAMDDLAPRLDMISEILMSGNVETGKLQSAALPIKQWAQSLGYQIDENLPLAEQVSSAMKYLAPRMRVAGSGSTSDGEMKSFAESTANFGNTTAGNILIARSALQIHRRNKKVANLASKYLRKNKNLEGFEEYADKQLGRIFPKPQTKAEYDALKPGTVWVDENGVYAVKRAKK